jgi:hypothetical protein
MRQPMETITRTLEITPQIQRFNIAFAAAPDWIDTSLQPDVLATRPLLIGEDFRMLFATDGKPLETPEPVIELRHIEVPSLKAQDQARGFEPALEDPRVTPSWQAVEIRGGSKLRFPRTPGRIEARVASVRCSRKVRGYQGFVRVMFCIHRAPGQDAVSRGPIDHMRVITFPCDLPEPPRLPDPKTAPVYDLAE